MKSAIRILDANECIDAIIALTDEIKLKQQNLAEDKHQLVEHLIHDGAVGCFTLDLRKARQFYNR